MIFPIVFFWTENITETDQMKLSMVPGINSPEVMAERRIPRGRAVNCTMGRTGLPHAPYVIALHKYAAVMLRKRQAFKDPSAFLHQSWAMARTGTDIF